MHRHSERTSSFHRLLIATTLSFTFVGGCRQIIVQPEGVTPSGRSLDPNLPKDPRLLPLLDAIKVSDRTLQPNYKTCVEKLYFADALSKVLPDKANTEVTTQYEYNNQGNKVKEVETYSFTSTYTTIREWKYDSLGRVESMIQSRPTASQFSSEVKQNCRVTYDGDSWRITQYQCFYGAEIAADKLIGSIEIVYDLNTNKRTISERSNQDGVVRLMRSVTEEHSDSDFRFALTSEATGFSYDGDTQKIESKTKYEVKFENEKFSSLVHSNELYLGSKTELSKTTCKFQENYLNCNNEFLNADGELYETGTSKSFPVFTKQRQADVLSWYGNYFSDPFEISFYRVEYSTRGIEGKKSSENEAPNTLYESVTTYDLQLRETKYSRYTLKDGKHSEVETSYEYSDGMTLMLRQSREFNGKAITREELGGKVTDTKSTTTCSI